MQLVSKISNLCDHKSPTSQTEDRRHAIARPRFALCIVHRAVKTGNISETVEDKAKVITINGLDKVVHGLSIAVKMYDLEWPLSEIHGCVCSNPYLFIVFSVFSVCKRSWNGIFGISLVDLLSAGLSQSLIPKLVTLSDSGSSITWWHVATYIRDLLLIYSFALKPHFLHFTDRSNCVWKAETVLMPPEAL